MKFNILPILLAVLFFASCTPAPEASFEYTMSSESSSEVVFTNTSENAEYYMWDFGDGSRRVASESPTYTYTKGGTYTVTLSAISGDKSNDFSQTITIKDQPRTQVEIVTNLGTMVAELYNETPKHRDNFIKLANEKFYDGLLFHRIIQGFMIQGGDPDSKGAPSGQPLGMGGPGYTIPAEIIPGMYHYKGALSAARLGDGQNPQRNSSGSQFYVVQGQAVNPSTLAQMSQRNQTVYDNNATSYYQSVGGAPFLDNQYTVFGYVRSEDFGVIDKIAAVPTSANANTPDRPIDDVVIESVRVIEPKETEAVQ